MPKPRTNAGWPAVILIAVVALPVGYMGAYYAMVERVFLEYGSTPNYRVEGDAISVLFEPAHWVDRNVRPSYWDEVRHP